jgi:hypothetical protein
MKNKAKEWIFLLMDSDFMFQPLPVCRFSHPYLPDGSGERGVLPVSLPVKLCLHQFPRSHSHNPADLNSRCGSKASFTDAPGREQPFRPVSLPEKPNVSVFPCGCSSFRLFRLICLLFG